MRTSTLALLCSLWASSAMAGPITNGVWSAMPELTHEGVTFFDHTSADCYTCGIAYLLSPGAEYLNDGNGGAVGFGFDGWTDFTKVSSQSDYDGTLGYDGVSFTYTANGFTSSSWQGTYMGLFRTVTAESTCYDLGVEDLQWGQPNHDGDYQDARYRMCVAAEQPPVIVPPVVPPVVPPILPPVGPPSTPPVVPTSVPEPETLVLFGMSVLALLGCKGRVNQRQCAPRREV